MSRYPKAWKKAQHEVRKVRQQPRPGTLARIANEQEDSRIRKALVRTNRLFMRPMIRAEKKAARQARHQALMAQHQARAEAENAAFEAELARAQAVIDAKAAAAKTDQTAEALTVPLEA